MGIAEDIKQGKDFKSSYEKLIVNILYTNGWLLDKQNKLLKTFGITSPQYNVMRILRGQYPKPCTVNTIIERMLDRMSNASRIVDRLETKRLVERTICESDRRAKDVLITAKGLKVLEQVDEALACWMKGFEGIDIQSVEGASEVLDAMRASIE
ncbi:MarR family winged helix-turn-helix transcriptional regulator [Roseivirga thermotolerans]|jgi:DNA-binding MarR family transcriptional regulator|uniref:MarR family transcriptional regulator n=1 Tax=Roseivirga thermotolerans TaxID=1758176 RepID=A0ABQ3I6E7_9BACT|nr:MarR family transcriptional regulator [Roseivirga thermotolerans]MEC7754735.1 MarR family transcriptional regulator [Bacteroidota bacterium]GHE68367.1 MarR family transcriptional regulator [Roseivirga thermotolerans]